jgi:membrane-associated protease RseP (regulator of RpoE activity)
VSATDTLSPASTPVGPAPPEPVARPEKSPRRLAAELIAALAAIVALSVATGHAYLLLVIVCIIVIVMVHELGHFLAAKHGGMKVTEYFVGFGPRLWSFRRGETEYGIKALPLGGYVKIPGMTNLEEVDPADEPRVYRDKPFHARLLVAVAGSAMHFLMAFVLLVALVTLVGVPNNNQVQIQGVTALNGKPGPAAAGGIRSGDVVVSVDGKPIRGSTQTLTSVIESHPGVPVTVVVDRGGRRKTLTVTPVNGRTHHESGASVPKGSAPYGIIGVSLGAPTQQVSPLDSLGSAGANLGHLMWASVVGVGHLFSPGEVSHQLDQVTSAKAASTAAANGTRVTSIVGVVQVATQAAQNGIGNLLYILIVINVFFGIFNLFPMLPLDGGHVAIAVYEKIRTGRRKVMYHADVAKLLPFAWLMMLILGIIILPALLTDILHPVTG